MGDGDRLTRIFLANRGYGWQEQGVEPSEAVNRAIQLLAREVVGLIVTRGSASAGGSKCDMEWAAVSEP